MSTNFLEILTSDGKRLYYDTLFRCESRSPDFAHLRYLANPFGRGDVQLAVPTVGEMIALGGSHSGFSVKCLADQMTGADKNSFIVSGPLGQNTTIEISPTFTSHDEMDYSQAVCGLAYLGVGGLVFQTDEMELHCLFGENLGDKAWFDLGYRSTENLRAYSSRNPCDHIRSLISCRGGYFLVNDIDYYIVTNPDAFGPGWLRKPAPSRFPLVNIRRLEDPMYIDEPVPPDTVGLAVIEGAFNNLLPIEVGEQLYVLQGSDRALRAHQIQGALHCEALREVAQIPVPAGTTCVRVCEI